MRSTRQRDVILQELRSVKTHPTADELYDMSRSRISNISLATIYRNLEYWADRGQVRRLEVSGGKRRYDGDISPHHHSRCSMCGRIFDLKVADSMIVENAMTPLLAINGVEDVTIELKRVCDECARG